MRWPRWMCAALGRTRNRAIIPIADQGPAEQAEAHAQGRPCLAALGPSGSLRRCHLDLGYIDDLLFRGDLHIRGLHVVLGQRHITRLGFLHLVLGERHVAFLGFAYVTRSKRCKSDGNDTDSDQLVHGGFTFSLGLMMGGPVLGTRITVWISPSPGLDACRKHGLCVVGRRAALQVGKQRPGAGACKMRGFRGALQRPPAPAGREARSHQATTLIH